MKITALNFHLSRGYIIQFRILVPWESPSLQGCQGGPPSWVMSELPWIVMQSKRVIRFLRLIRHHYTNLWWHPSLSILSVSPSYAHQHFSPLDQSSRWTQWEDGIRAEWTSTPLPSHTEGTEKSIPFTVKVLWVIFPQNIFKNFNVFSVWYM